MRRSWVHSVVCAWTTCAVLFGGCRTAPTPVRTPAPATSVTQPAPLATPTGRPEVAITTGSDEGRLTLRLGSSGVVAPAAAVTMLSAQETNALLARAEALPTLDNTGAPIVRPPSAPPPRSGVIQPIAFVAQTGTVIADKPVSPTADRPAGTVIALSSPQILPVGEVHAESEVRIRFAEPMVPVASVGESKTPVATITPVVAGTWRWIDTRVAQFTAAASRLPMATELTVTVPKGTTAVSGAVLPVDVTGTFKTPPVQLTNVYPNIGVRPDSPILVEFDQEVDPATIVKFLRVEGRTKRRALPFTVTTLAEAKKLWARNPSLKKDSDDRFGKHYIVLAPKGAWPSGVEARVVLAPKAPSKEGPRLTVEDSGVAFDVARAFVVEGITCAGQGDRPRKTGVRCPANSYLTVNFSNDIDTSTYRSRHVQITGEPFEDHTPSYSSVSLETPLKVGGSYAIGVGTGITDIYGQSLVGTRDLAFTTTRIVHEPFVNARGGLYVLDPRFEIPQWVIQTQAIASLHVELWQVEASDYFRYVEYEGGQAKTPPGKRVYEKDFKVGARMGATARIDLRPALPHGTGHVIAIARATPAAGATKLPAEEQRTHAWIQVTKLGVSARIDRERLHAWTHDITPSSFLKPLQGVQTSVLVEHRSDAPPPVTADADGHAAYELLPYLEPKPNAQHYPRAVLQAKLGNDTAFVAIGGRYEKLIRRTDARWYVTDDRFTYKPGEPLYIKGWVRWTDDAINPVLRVPTPSDQLTYSLADSKGNRIANGTTAFTPQGGFDLEITLPPNVNLGTAMLTLSTNKDSHRHPVSIEEFRTPAFMVNLTDDVLFNATRPLVLGESISMSTEAKYYAGGGLAGSTISWAAHLRAASYKPPGWDRYTFEPAVPRSQRTYWGRRERGETVYQSVDGTLSGASTSALEIDLQALPGRAPSVLEVDATVTDIDRQTLRATSRKILVHPATRYVGVRLDPTNDRQLQVIVTDIDGNAVAGVPVDVAIEGVLGSERYRDDAEIVDTQSCKLTSAATPVTCGFKRKDYKTAYTVDARVKDPRGREMTAQYEIPWWTYQDQDLAVELDKQLYKPGDVAKVTIKSKTLPAHAIVSFARNGVMAQKQVELSATGTSVELPIVPAFIQNVQVVVDRVTKRTHQNKAPKVAAASLPLPQMDSLEVDMPVDLDAARLVVRTRPLAPLVEPGAEATFDVEVKHEDKPVKGAEVALIVVDEAVLAISGKQHADPLTPFYDRVAHGTWRVNNMGMVEDAGHELAGTPGFESWSLDTGLRGGWGTGSGYGVGGGRGSMSGRSSSVPSVAMAIKSRKDFRATAVFSPKLETDARGMARVTVKMPDSLTRYRIVALATANTQYFGKAENNIVAQLKVNARTVAPRFLTQGDRFSLPVVVQNLADAPRTIDVAVRAANLSAIGPQGKRVIVPGGERAEVRFEFATQTRGTAVIQTVAASGDFADSSNVEVPVYEPATTESFATYGSVTDQPQFEQLKIPTDVFAEVGGIEAEVASTQLQNLTDAYWYLYAYPFECAEQRSSRMIATTAMYDVLDAFAVGHKPSKQKIAEQRSYDVKRLTRDQRPDGGWGYFRDMESDPFVTMQVLTALGLQREAGPVTKNATAYVTKRFTALLAGLEKQVKARDVKLRSGQDAADISLAAAALTALAATGLDVTARATKLHAVALAVGNYPVDAKARLLAIVAGKPAHAKLRAKLLADLLSVVHETAAAATVTVSYTDAERMLLVSTPKTTALTLDAILREQPQHALVTKLARNLLDGRKRGRWLSTQENVVVLQAMRRYFDIYEKETPNFTGKLWLGSAAYAEQTFAGRTTTTAVTRADWSMLAPGSTHDIAITKSGPGRMYYRLGITYAPKQTNLPPLDAGFVVRRSYTPVDSPSDVVQQPDGTWHVKLGARVLVQLEAINTSARHAVAVVDPLPAGFESVNTRLATAERAVSDPTADHWDHIAMRGNRSEAFTMHLPEGTHRFSYTARATTPGTFIAAPAKAEEMYSPETFGRSAGTVVVVR